MTCTGTRHGTATAYQAYGCRCPEAKEAQRLYKKRRALRQYQGKPNRVPAIGARRRLQALMVNGWPSHDLMAHLGYSTGGNWILYAESLHVDTADRVAKMYDRLWDKPGPSKWVATWARNKGFAPPMAWDDVLIDDPLCQPFMENVQDLHIDEIAVERFVHGDIDWRKLTVAERIQGAVRLDRLGYSRKQIFDRCHVNTQQLQIALSKANGRRRASETDEMVAS